jgi:hypothetical protein
MRNIFDQYSQPENKLTHALVSTLSRDKHLIPKFLRWCKISTIPSAKQIQLVEQQIPGTQIMADDNSSGLPDACFYNNDGWAVAVESKVQSSVSFHQLKRHFDTLARYGYENATVILISVNRPQQKLPSYVTCIEWQQIYRWFESIGANSSWGRTFIDYMQIFESKMLTQEYEIQGTITMFDGFHFDEKRPYTYHEGKRLIRLLGQELRKNKRLIHRLHIDSHGSGRPAITRGKNGHVWDFIPFKVSQKALNFTDYPHITIGVAPDYVGADLTIPNGIKGGIKTKLNRLGFEEFKTIIKTVEKNLRPVVKKAPGTKPMMYLSQTHHKTRRSPSEIDARLDVDFRTLVQGSTLKYQPKWLETIYEVLTNKRTNIQFGIEVRFPYSCSIIQSQKAIDIMVDAWIGLVPVLNFVIKE